MLLPLFIIQYVMVNFEEATDEIYGYLLIDLNPTTNTTRLIRATVFPCDSVEETWNGIKEIDTSDSDLLLARCLLVKIGKRRFTESRTQWCLSNRKQSGSGLESSSPEWYLKGIQKRKRN